MAAADWWRGCVFYHVYPRSFADSNGDGIGDLNGVRARLTHIASLGVGAIWLSPFFASPMKDFGYDVSDYRAVAPEFGTLADFDALLAEAHALGLRVIIDQVWSHTSDAHAWFADSVARGEQADWYVWADAKSDGSPPNNWQAAFGGSSWTWHPRRRQYYLHNFLTCQPDLNFHNPAVQDAILDIARFWLDRGVDGFRLDVINMIAHDPALTDNPRAGWTRTPALTARFQRHLHDHSRPEALAFVERLRGVLDGYEGRMAVGEIVDADALARQREYSAPGRLHTAYSFFLLAAQAATPALFAEALGGWADAPGWPSWSLGNHDVARFSTRLAGDDADFARVLLAVLLTLRGTPFLYQGDELGLPQGRVDDAARRDPFDIAADGGVGRDGARTPMVWDDAPGGGFTEGTPWLPIDPAHLPLAATTQEGDPASLLHFVRAMIALRNAEPALQVGDCGDVTATDALLAFTRHDGAARLRCLFNLSPTAIDIAETGTALLIFPDTTAVGDAIRLAPYGGAILRV